MKKIGLITFHAAHNYGSMLQNYALQRAIRSLSDDFQVETINMRSTRQKEQYDYFRLPWNYEDKKRVILSLLYLPYKKSLKDKHERFERFLKNRLALSDDVKELSKETFCSDYDAIISGSDQIWNLRAYDFSWNYFLDFAPEGTRKISYAASAGSFPLSQMDIYSKEKERINALLSRYHTVSVREDKTARLIEEITSGAIAPKVTPDPTLLISTEDWDSLIDTTPIIERKYIFLYNPYYLKEVYRQGEELKRLTGLPVVVSNINARSIIPSLRFYKRLGSGPEEFLNLISNAEFVIGKSFHLGVFSTLFSKKFIAVNGMEDSRLSSFLTKLGIAGTASCGCVDTKVIDRVVSIDYKTVKERIEKGKEAGLDFLKNSLVGL